VNDALRPMDRAENAAREGDAGFTLTELLMAMAIFGILMAIVGGAMLSGFSTIRTVIAETSDQADVQNSAEWTTRLLRYMAIPTGRTTAIDQLGPTSITFYTFSGTGDRNDVPYKARISTITNANGSTSLVSDLWTPTMVAAAWTWPEPATRRTLLTVAPGVAAPLRLTLATCDSLTDCTSVKREIVPAVLGPVSLDVGEVPLAVTITIGNPAEPGTVVTQRVRLVNLG
jgi:prepilin-type N-terminal cleavage/methylation domain-containing protein